MTTPVAVHSMNGIDLDVLQETVQAVTREPELGKCQFRASNKWIAANHNSTTVSDYYAAKEEMSHQRPYTMHADEPPMLAGQDEAPNPVEHLLHALASCITTSIVAHAAVRGIPITSVESKLEGDIDLRGFLGIADNVPKGYTNIRVNIRANTDAKNLKRLQRLAEFSPVLNTVTNGVKVDIQVRAA